MYDNYIFDLYGTLVDIRTEEENPCVWEKMCLFYGYYGAHYTQEEMKTAYSNIITKQEAGMKDVQPKEKQYAHEAFPELKLETVFAELFRRKQIEADETLAVHAGQFFRVLSTDYVKVYDGAEKLLEGLKKCGKKIYLLSNAQRIFTEYEMHFLGIAKYFDDIFISSDYGIRKPDIRFFQTLLDKHRMDVSRSIMIGNDAQTDIAGAVQAGLASCYIHSNISPECEHFPDADIVLPEMDMAKLTAILLDAK